MGVIPPETKLAPRNPGVKPWSELSVNEQRFAARLQEAFAAMLDHTDAQIGRLSAFLKSVGQWDNTLFVVLSDNGASQEGGPTGVLDEMKWFNGIRENVDEAVRAAGRHRRPQQPLQHPLGLGPGRQHAAEVVQAEHPRRRRARSADHALAGGAEGGRRDPRPVLPRHRHRPDHPRRPGHRAARGGRRRAADAGARRQPCPDLRRSRRQAGARPAVFRDARPPRRLEDGWKAVTHHEPGMPFDDDKWELYHLDEDFSEHDDLAAGEPARLKEMVDLWWAEAERHGVLPLDDRGPIACSRASMPAGTAVVAPTASPTIRRSRTSSPTPAPRWRAAGPPRSSSTTRPGRRRRPDGLRQPQQRLALFVKDGRLVFDYNEFHRHTRVEAATPLTPGEHTHRAGRRPRRRRRRRRRPRRRRRGGGQRPWPRLLFMISSTGMDLGRSLSPVTDDYAAPVRLSRQASTRWCSTPRRCRRSARSRPRSGRR